MLAAADVAIGPEYAIRTVTCNNDHSGWSRPKVRDEYNLVLVRQGRFRRQVEGVCADVDATLGYVGVPGEEEHFAHPAGATCAPGSTCDRTCGRN